MSETTQKPAGGTLKFVRDLIVIALVALLFSFLLKTFLLRSFFIPSGSMENTLQVDDRVMVNQLVPNVMEINRGDVIVFKDPGGWLMGHPKPELNGLQQVMQFVGLQPDASNNYLIKRVIGVGGDTVKCCTDGKLEINGVVIDEPYIVIPEGEIAASGIEFEVTVPENSLWVLGDNRFASQDSRYQMEGPSNGFVPVSEVVGRAFLLNWPISRFGTIDNYPEVFANVPQP